MALEYLDVGNHDARVKKSQAGFEYEQDLAQSCGLCCNRIEALGSAPNPTLNSRVEGLGFCVGPHGATPYTLNLKP